MIKAVIFDLDGTLYEPRFFPLRLILADPGNILKLAAERRCRRQLQGRCFGSGDEYYDELFLLMGKGNEEKAQRCREWFWRRYLPNQVRIIREDFYKRPQLKDLMLRLRRDGYRTAVLSDYALAEEKLAACGMGGILFNGVWESPELGGLKPCPQVFTKACSLLGVRPEETLMIGDRVKTDGGATEAGLQFIHLIEKEKDRGKHGPLCKDMLWSEILEYFKVLA